MIHVDPCDLKPEGGFCRGSFERFYYDQTVKTCLPFIYGGCNGNRNNFESYEDCVQACAPKVAIVPDNDFTNPKEENSKDGDTDKFIVTEPVVEVPSIGVQATFKSPACAEKPITGQCFGYFPRYYYNAAKDSCEEFIYGGCDGNRNNFETVQECENSCKLGTAPSEKSTHAQTENSQFPDLAQYKVYGHACEQEFGMQGGSNGLKCMAFFPSWSFDKKDGACKRFIYGGCGGNSNRFSTKEECEKKCL